MIPSAFVSWHFSLPPLPPPASSPACTRHFGEEQSYGNCLQIFRAVEQRGDWRPTMPARIKRAALVAGETRGFTLTADMCQRVGSYLCAARARTLGEGVGLCSNLLPPRRDSTASAPLSEGSDPVWSGHTRLHFGQEKKTPLFTPHGLHACPIGSARLPVWNAAADIAGGAVEYLETRSGNMLCFPEEVPDSSSFFFLLVGST